MKGNAKVIQAFNDILTAELTAINQYFVHAKMCQNWGYKRLAEHSRHEAIDEMKHADQLIDRILFLDGIPNMQRLGKIKIGETVLEQFKVDLGLELEAVKRLNTAIDLAVQVHDNGSRDLIESILTSEEEHIDWLEAQLELIEQVGEQNYLAEQIRS